jgi:hypothetical protein
VFRAKLGLCVGSKTYRPIVGKPEALDVGMHSDPLAFLRCLHFIDLHIVEKLGLNCVGLSAWHIRMRKAAGVRSATNELHHLPVS